MGTRMRYYTTCTKEWKVTTTECKNGWMTSVEHLTDGEWKLTDFDRQAKAARDTHFRRVAEARELE